MQKNRFFFLQFTHRDADDSKALFISKNKKTQDERLKALTVYAIGDRSQAKIKLNVRKNVNKFLSQILNLKKSGF